MRILIIDDDELVARSICRMLHGHDTIAAVDPRAALTRLRSGERFDLVLCDLKMPLMNGFDVLAEIDAWFEVAAPMLLLMTGAEGVAGVSTVSILTKPFDKLELDAAIAVLVQRRERRKESTTARLPMCGR